jgi:hypothetical protein
VELKDETAAPDKDPRQPAVRSSLAAANSTVLEASLALLRPAGKGASEWRRLEHMAAGRRLTGVDKATVAADNAVGTTDL